MKRFSCSTRLFLFVHAGGAGSQVLADVLKRDIYAVGAITWAMLHGKSPTDRLLNERIRGSVGAKGAQVFIQKLCAFSPRYRPSAKDALKSYWLKQRVCPVVLFV